MSHVGPNTDKGGGRLLHLLCFLKVSLNLLDAQQWAIHLHREQNTISQRGDPGKKLCDFSD